MKKSLLIGAALLTLVGCAQGVKELDSIQVLINNSDKLYYKNMECNELNAEYVYNRKEFKVAADAVDILQKNENDSQVAGILIAALGAGLATNQYQQGNYTSAAIVSGIASGTASGAIQRGIDHENRKHPRQNYLYLKRQEEAIQWASLRNDCNLKHIPIIRAKVLEEQEEERLKLEQANVKPSGWKNN